MEEEKSDGFDTRQIDILIARKRSEKTKIRVISIVLACVFGLGIVATVFGVYVKNHINQDVDLSVYQMAKSENVTRFYYYNESGETLEVDGSAIYPAQKQLYAPYETIPSNLINAFIAIEDKRFYEHNGVDWYRAVGAGLNYIFNFQGSFGASTITQQLVKNVTGNDEYKIDRKIQEMFSAMSLEEKLEKTEILEIYLNVINLSRGCKGVRSAALTYFSKELEELTLLECVCLAAITNSPTYYDPYLNPENNKDRRKLIFDQMLVQGFISREDYEKNYDADLDLNMSEEYKAQKTNSWYIDMVISDVINDLCSEYGYSESEASDMIYSGGLRIETLMDPEIQNIVEKYYAEASNFPDDGAQSSMIIIDPYTGAILGVAGGRGEKNANRIQNYATETLRPSGSVIKPLSIYAPALEERILTYASVYDDVPVSFVDNNSPWPNNAPTVYHGLVNINYAIEVSLNTVPIKVLEELGKEDAFYFLKEKLGMDNLIESLTLESGVTLTDMDVASLALGQMNYGLTVREVTAGYSIFINQGNYNTPRSYARVTDGFGNLLLENNEKVNKAISADNAYVMNTMLMNVVDYGTAEGITLDKRTSVAGKTGTSQDYYDRWFIGYTPSYLGGVWYGYEYPESLGSNTKHICTEIWDGVMSEIYSAKQKSTYEKFERPDNIVTIMYCKDSGKLMTDACRADPRGDRSEIGYFVSGTEPYAKCDCHVLVDYDRILGGVADPSCPDYYKVKVGLIQVERHFPVQVYVSDAQYVYKKIPSDVLPGDSDDEPFFVNMLSSGDYCGISYVEKQYNRYCTEHFNYLAWLLRRKLHN